MKINFLNSTIIMMVLFKSIFYSSYCVAQKITPDKDSVKVQGIFDKVIANFMVDFLKNEMSIPNEMLQQKDSLEKIKKYIEDCYTNKDLKVNQLFGKLLKKKENYRNGMNGRKFIQNAILSINVDFHYDKEKIEELILLIPLENEQEIQLISTIKDTIGEVSHRTIGNVRTLPQRGYLENILCFLLGVFFILGYQKLKMGNEIIKTEHNSIEQPFPKTEKLKSVSDLDVEWRVLHASQIGKSHITAKPEIPCQDSHAVKYLREGWGIAVVCDGAGSAKHSDKGSAFVVNEAIKLFSKIIEENKWIEKGILPPENTWKNLCTKALQKLCYDTKEHSKIIGVSFKDLACTIIVVIYTPFGLIYTHIGDGRAGYKSSKGIWKGLIDPHKGEEDNHTIFLTTAAWWNGDLKMRGIEVPQSGVIKDSIVAFTLMSDGCEQHVFEIGYFDEKDQKVIPQNQPYNKLFDALIDQVDSFEQEGMNFDQMQEKWERFVLEGTKGLKNELDDKTLIMGIRLK